MNMISKKKILNDKINITGIVQVLILFVFSLLVHRIFNVKDYIFDAGWYWGLGKEIQSSVLDLGSGYRGYVFPVFTSICYKFGILLGNEYWGFWIISSLTFTFLFTYVYKNIAMLFGYDRNSKYLGWTGVVCGGLTFVLFRGLFLYPLSDIYAFVLSLCGILLINRMITGEHKWKKYFFAFLLGVLLYGIYNIRTIYLFYGIAIVVVISMYYLVVRRKWGEFFVFAVLCGCGVFICALPQIMLNHRLLGIYSMEVPTDGLMLQQLYWGLQCTRYDTFMGHPSEYAAASMFYDDRIGLQILDKERIFVFSSYGQFFKLILKYPFDIAGIYVRHFISMLYPFFPNQYVTSVNNIKIIYMILFYSLFFITCTTFDIKIKKENIGKWITMILILTPCICILPGAVEMRFFVAMHFLIYMFAVLSVKKFVRKWRQKKLQCMAYYLVGLLIYIGWSGYLLSSLPGGMVILG